MASQSIGASEAGFPKCPAMSGRLNYEDRRARISIMARVNAQGPDRLQQTVETNSQKSTCRLRAGHTFGKDRSMRVFR